LQLSIHQKDIEIINLFIKEISPQTKSKYREYDKTETIVINSMKLVKDLCKQLKLKGPGKKSDDIVLPDLSDELMWSFLRGLFDSDGSVANPMGKRTDPSCCIASMSIPIKEQIQKYCEKYEIKSYVSRTKIDFSGYNALKFMKHIYENTEYFLKRKYDFHKSWSSWEPFKGTTERPMIRKCDKTKMNLTKLPWYKKKYGDQNIKKYNDKC
jgi:hypothetical protein